MSYSKIGTLLLICLSITNSLSFLLKADKKPTLSSNNWGVNALFVLNGNAGEVNPVMPLAKQFVQKGGKADFVLLKAHNAVQEQFDAMDELGSDYMIRTKFDAFSKDHWETLKYALAEVLLTNDGQEIEDDAVEYKVNH